MWEKVPYGKCFHRRLISLRMRNLIWAFAVRQKYLILVYPQSAQRELWPNYANAQPDLSPCRVQMSKGTFSDVVAHEAVLGRLLISFFEIASFNYVLIGSLRLASTALTLTYSVHRNNPNYWDRQTWANSVDSDQTPRIAASDQSTLFVTHPEVCHIDR